MAKKKETVAAVPVLEFIELSLVRTSALNPRKEFHEAELSDLTASIKKLGVIQPITVRKHPEGGYELVCGERRYHGSVAAGLKEIPASIRELTDAEAMELMITENLQRKDVHPLEEADAFQFMIDSMGYELATIGARVGKNEPFVARRLQLVKLTPKLKEAFKADKITIGHAELLCRIDAVDQDYWEENQLNGWNGAGTVKSLKDHLNNRVDKKLATATFDITAEVADTIPCTICPANSACNTSLFPDKMDVAICHNSACFNKKSAVAFSQKLDKVLADPFTILIHAYGGESSEIVVNLKKEGYKIFKQYDDYSFSSIRPPEEPSLSYYDLEDYESQEELDEDYKTDCDTYQDDLFEYEQKIKDIESGEGEYKKAFMLTGYDAGKTFIVTLSGKAAAASPTEPGDQSKLKIIDLKQKLIRGKELDQEKLHVKIKDHIKNLPVINEFDDANILLEPIESTALIAMAYTKIGYAYGSGSVVDKINDLLGLNKGGNYYNKGDLVFEAIKKAPLEVRSFIVRVALNRNFADNAPSSLGGAVTFALAELWDPETYGILKAEQDAVCEKRETRINKQIEELTP